MDWEKLIVGIGVAVVVLMALFLIFVIVWAIVETPTSVRTQLACVEVGYPDYKIVWFLQPYCVGWEDGTKFIVPLEEAAEIEFVPGMSFEDE